jgi:hypothetical protein
MRGSAFALHQRLAVGLILPIVCAMLKNQDFSPEYERASGDWLQMVDMSHIDHHGGRPRRCRNGGQRHIEREFQWCPVDLIVSIN